MGGRCLSLVIVDYACMFVVCEIAGSSIKSYVKIVKNMNCLSLEPVHNYGFWHSERQMQLSVIFCSPGKSSHWSYANNPIFQGFAGMLTLQCYNFLSKLITCYSGMNLAFSDN